MLRRRRFGKARRIAAIAMLAIKKELGDNAKAAG
jgi:hypothetical protein